MLERYKTIILFMNENKLFSLESISHNLGYSSRKVQMLITELREFVDDYGFEIETRHGKGYSLNVIDQKKYNLLIDSLSELKTWAFDSQTQRINVIISLLLTNNNDISIQDIATIIDVSRSTIMRDLVEVERKLEEHNLELVKKQYQGIRIEGEELSKRQMFAIISKETSDLKMLSSDFQKFINNLDTHILMEILHQSLSKYEIEISDEAFQSLLEHLLILLYRSNTKNYISNVGYDNEQINQNYIRASEETLLRLGNEYEISIPRQEIDFLTVQLVGKTNVENIPKQQKDKIKNQITSCLEKIDTEFSTEMNDDEILKQSLMFHIYPMMMRLSYGMALENSIIDFISVQYTNSFLIALKFIEHYQMFEESISRDEVGFLAIHFASYFDRVNDKRLKSIKTILIISESKRSSSQFTKQKISTVFPNAKIELRSYNQLENVSFNDVDIVLATQETNLVPRNSVSFIISELITEKEIDSIKNTIGSSFLFKVQSLKLVDFFNEDLYFVERKESDYLKILYKYSTEMVKKGYAAENFPNSVLNREKRFTTIYENGVAGPHSMDQNAVKDSIAVVVLTQPVSYQGRNVDIILIINAKQGHLFLHKTISDFLLTLINNEDIRQIIRAYPSFQEFKNLIERYQ